MTCFCPDFEKKFLILFYGKNLENVLTNGRQTMRKINERFRHLVSLSGKRKKTDNKKKKKEAEKRTDEKGATKLNKSYFMS